MCVGVADTACGMTTGIVDALVERWVKELRLMQRKGRTFKLKPHGSCQSRIYCCKELFEEGSCMCDNEGISNSMEDIYLKQSRERYFKFSKQTFEDFKDLLGNACVRNWYSVCWRDEKERRCRKAIWRKG